jgi:hypothetical protein
MKTVFNYRNAAIALFSLFTIAVAPVANASNDKGIIDEKNNVAVELRFLGNFKNQPVFELSFANAPAGTEFVVNIRDAYGTSLYRETLNSNIISKKFLLNTDEIGDDAVRFEITAKKDNKTVVYSVNQYTRFVEEVAVTRVNN